MKITERQFRVLRQLILDRHAAFVANYISPSVLSEATLARLRKLGLFQAKANAVRDAYVLGIMGAQANQATPPKTYSELKARMIARPIPLSAQERAAVSVAQLHAGQYITALGEKIAKQAGQMVLTQDTRQANVEREAYAEEVADAVANRKSVGALKSALGHRVGDFTRDLERVANTELSSALNLGTAAAAARQHGPDVKVACLHSPTCCDACRRLLTDNGVTPKIFRLADLQANGTNVGRKAAEWLPVVPPQHPNCARGDTEILTRAGAKAIRDVLPGEYVLTHRGRWQPVRAVWSSPFTGLLASVLFDDGAAIAVTPNHRFRAAGSWYTALGLQAGEHAAEGFLVDSAAGLHLDAKDAPAQRSQDVRLAHVLRILSAGRVPATAIYFDGKLFVGAGEVDQEDIDRIAGASTDANLLERLEHRLFTGTFERTDVGLLARQNVRPGLFGAPDGLMRCTDEVIPLPPGQLTKPQLSALAMCAQAAIAAFEAAANGGLPSAESTRQHRNAQALIPVESLDRIGVQRRSNGRIVSHAPESNCDISVGNSGSLSDLEGRAPAAFELMPDSVEGEAVVAVSSQGIDFEVAAQKASHPFDRYAGHGSDLSWTHQIVLVKTTDSRLLSFGQPSGDGGVGHIAFVPPMHRTVKRVVPIPHEGLVYNLSVAEDESYVANGIAAKNCGCTMVVVPDGMGFNERGQLVELGDA